MTKTHKIIYYTILTIVSGMFVFSGYMKTSGDPMSVAGFTKAHLPLWFMYFIGAAEIAGGIGLWVPKLQKWAVYGLYIIMGGAIVVTALFENLLYALMPILFIVLLTIIMKLGRKQSLPTTPTTPPPSA